MQYPPGTDAERLQAIHQLEQAIQARQPDLAAARRQHDDARRWERERQAALREVDAQISVIGREVRRRGSAVYLDGHRLDRGILTLGNEALRFVGWHGRLDVPLAAITTVELGTSFLPPRSGLPLLARVWPGQPRPGETLLLTVGSPATTTTHLAVLAHVGQAETWREAIHQAQGRLGDVAAQRAGLEVEQARVAAALAEARARLTERQVALEVIEREVGDLRARQRQLQEQQHQIEAARERAVKAEREALKRRKKR